MIHFAFTLVRQIYNNLMFIGIPRIIRILSENIIIYIIGFSYLIRKSNNINDQKYTYCKICSVTIIVNTWNIVCYRHCERLYIINN